MSDKGNEFKRAVGAARSLEIAIACLQVAKAEVSVTLKEEHDTTKAVNKALQQTRIAAKLLDHAVLTLGRTL